MRKFVWVCLFIGFVIGLRAQNNGLPIITNYEPDQYKGSPQNWQLSFLPSGKLIVANEFGLLTFNGRTWSLIEEEVGYSSRSILVTDSVALLGIDNDILEMSADSSGKLIFKSILPHLPDSISSFGRVRKIEIIKEKLVFLTDDFVFRIKGNQIESAYSEDKIQRLFWMNEVLYVTIQDQGLFRFQDNRFLPVIEHQLFTHNKPVKFWKKEKGFDVLTEKGQLYHVEVDVYGYGRKINLLKETFIEALDGDRVEEWYDFKNGWFGIAATESGFYVLNEDFQELFHLTEEDGLQNDEVYEAKMDRYGSIWLTLANGISKIDGTYPVTNYDNRKGLDGTVESFTTIDSKLFASTHSGLYHFDESKNQFIEDLPLQVWDLAELVIDKDKKRLLATNNDISEWKSNGEVETIFECYPWKLMPLQQSKSTVLVGMDPGLVALKYENGNWHIGQENLEVESAIGNFYEDESGIWLGTRESFPYRLEKIDWQKDSTIYKGLEKFGLESGIPDSDVNTFKWRGKNLFGTSQGIYKFNNGVFSRFTDFSNFDSKALVHRIYNNDDKELWMFTFMNDSYSIGYMDSSNQWNCRLFNPISDDIVQAISKDREGNILFGGSGGIHQYNKNRKFDIETPYQTTITRVSVMDDSLIYSGYWRDSIGTFTHVQPNSLKPKFHYKTNAIAFEFSSSTFGNIEDVRFSYVLEGNNDNWSKWTHDIKKEYTNLPAGDYTFTVKALNIFETESEVAQYSFTIEKPWFQTWWYYTLQTSILLLLVLLTVVLNRSGKPTAFSSIIAFVTIITVFEFVIMIVEPYLVQYTGEIPVFNLIMNVLMAASLAPVERLVRNFLARKHHE